MLLSPLYTWKSRPDKSLTKRVLIALFLIPVSLYFLIDAFNTKGMQKNNHFLLNTDKSTDSIPLYEEDLVGVSDKHAFVSALELRESEAKQDSRGAKIIEDEYESIYRIISASDSEGENSKK